MTAHPGEFQITCESASISGPAAAPSGGDLCDSVDLTLVSSRAAAGPADGDAPTDASLPAGGLLLTLLGPARQQLCAGCTLAVRAEMHHLEYVSLLDLDRAGLVGGVSCEPAPPLQCAAPSPAASG